MRYVIIGNGTAAVAAAEGIRSLDALGKITLISEEKYGVYSRPLISYLLQGKTDTEKMRYRPADFYETHHIDARFSVRAVGLDKEKKTVTLSDGAEVPYDKLLLATGSRPAVPRIQGIDTVKELYTFQSLDDALALQRACAKDKNVLIVGAGLIGMKCAEGIYSHVGQITVVDIADRILPSILDAEAGEYMTKMVRAKGVNLLLQDGVDSFCENTVKLKSGKTLSFDLCVMAVGVTPNTELAVQAGCDVRRGIATDDEGRTSVEDIWAAGDCCLSVDAVDGVQKMLALLPNAYMQGESAGLCMAGGHKPFTKAIPMNAMGLFGLHMITAGDTVGKDSRVYVVHQGVNYKKLVVRDGMLKGYILIGDVSRAGIYTALIREKTPLDSLDFELICEKPQLMAFSRRVRSQKLGGEL